MSRIWAIGASVRALAQSLVGSGHEVVAADLFNDLDLQRIASQLQRINNYPHDLLHLTDEVEADAFIYTGGLENYPDLIDALTEKLPLLGNPGHVLRRVRDLPTLDEALKRGGFQMPPISQSAPLTTRQRWLRKSADSSGGLRVGWADDDSGLRLGEYFQTFVEGPVYGASFNATAEGTQSLGIARQLTDCSWTDAPSFHYAGSIGPIQLNDGLQRQIQRLGELVVKEFGLRGWFGIDFIVDPSGQLWVLEVNPRYTASMEVLERRGRQFAGKAVLYAKWRISVTSEFVARLFQRLDVADIPSPASEIAANSPVLTIFADGASDAAVVAELQAKAGLLRADLSKLRTEPAAGR